MIRPGRRAVAAGAVVALVVVLGPACSGGDDGRPATRATGRWGQVYDNLCLAAAAAGKGQPDRAKADFDDVHGALHELAAAVERKDRAVAAHLLEAKQKVEAETTAPQAADLEALSVTVADGIRITGGTAPRHCP